MTPENVVEVPTTLSDWVPNDNAELLTAPPLKVPKSIFRLRFRLLLDSTAPAPKDKLADVTSPLPINQP